MNTERTRAHKVLNTLQSITMLAGMGALLAATGWLLGGFEVMIGVFIAGVTLLLLTPKLSSRWVLAMYRARVLGPREAPRLYAVAQYLAQQAQLPHTPTLYYVPSRMVNAFTLGKADDAAIAFTDGLLRLLQPRELAGVLAHEMAHIRNRDIWVMSTADMVSRLTGILAFLGQILLFINLPLIIFTDAVIPWLAILLLILAPTLTALLQFALSRTREYEADRTAAELTGDPQGLASALSKLEYQEHRAWRRILLPSYENPQPSLLRTHPPTAQRIARLMDMAQAAPLGLPSTPSQDPWLAPHIRVVRRVPRWHIHGLWY